MGSLKKDEILRREGMSYALRVAKEKGVDGLEEELNRRNATEIPIRTTQAQITEYSQAVKHNIVFYMGVLVRNILLDFFDFDKEQLEKFNELLTSRSECISGDYTTWQEQMDILNEEVVLNVVDEGIDTTIRI